MSAPKKVDYSLLEKPWRAGIVTPRQMAKDYKAETGIEISHVAIIKHFEKLQVPRSLLAQIQEKAQAMVNESMVTNKVNVLTKSEDVDIIAANATMQAEKILSHRTDITRFRILVTKLIAELESQTDNLELFESLGEMMRAEDKNGTDKLNDLYQKVISTGSRSATVKTLADTLKTLIALEREAFGLDKGINKAQSIGEFLEGLQ